EEDVVHACPASLRIMGHRFPIQSCVHTEFCRMSALWLPTNGQTCTHSGHIIFAKLSYDRCAMRCPDCGAVWFAWIAPKEVLRGAVGNAWDLGPCKRGDSHYGGACSGSGCCPRAIGCSQPASSGGRMPQQQRADFARPFD